MHVMFEVTLVAGVSLLHPAGEMWVQEAALVDSGAAKVRIARKEAKCSRW